MFDEAKRWKTYSTVLATKGIDVHYSADAPTASYNLSTRQIILPVWDCLDEATTQALASHEIGHAKFSSYELDNFKELVERYRDLFNVVEDARIERLMKKEFQGLGAIFKEGYSNLAAAKVFPLNGIEDANLVERLNIFAKFGFMVEVPFRNQMESAFAYRLLNLSTKTDVIDLCEDILDYLKDRSLEVNLQMQKSESGESAESDGVDVEEDEEESAIGVNDEADSNGEKNLSEQKDEDENGSGSVQNDEEASEGNDLEEELTDSRMRSLERSLRDRFEEEHVRPNGMVVQPLVLFSKDILGICYEDLSAGGLDWRKVDGKDIKAKSRRMKEMIEKCASEAASIFAQKKSALENSNRRKLHSGRLDTKKLARHSVSDAIFKMTERLAQGKSHGVVLLLDCSESMTRNKDVQTASCIQAGILGRFCQMTGIPFSILIFGANNYYGWTALTNKTVFKVADSSTFDLDFILALSELSSFKVLNVKSSTGERCSLKYGGCTPIIQAMMAARNEVLKMRSCGVEKAAVIISTDGAYTKEVYTSRGRVDFRTGITHMLLDGKSFDIKDFSDINMKMAESVHDWGFELIAGYLKKETGASIIFSSIASEHHLLNSRRYWREIAERNASGLSTHDLHCGTYFEPYYFKRMFLLNQSNEVSFDKPCIAKKVKGDMLIDQYIMMNSDLIGPEKTAVKDFKGLDSESLIQKVGSVGRILASYKAFARAFVDFFS